MGRLEAAVRQAPTPPAASETGRKGHAPPMSRREKIDRLKMLMEAVRTEVILTHPEDWTAAVKSIVRNRGLRTLLYAPGLAVGRSLEAAWEDNDDGCRLVAYGDDIEHFKDTLFDLDAAITTTRGGVADTGAVILWPDAYEPRAMSLVPHLHIAILDADAIYDSLAEAITAGRWADRMPTNALLISGPSKTADIEFTLAFGVHGPKALVVLIRDPEHPRRGETP
jgi:L-lactate dehydrogenase complex protein LldG